jgi:hypothetical protein
MMRRLVRPTLGVTAVLVFFSSINPGGFCFMDMAAGSLQHDCCRTTTLAAAPPECCASAPDNVPAVTAHQAPRALPLRAGLLSVVPSLAPGRLRSCLVEVSAVGPSPPALLRL